jgi:ferredoxin-NADP reductase/ferredoxin
MAEIVYEKNTYAASEGESVLDCLQRHGHDIPHGCKVGACHSCLMVAASGKPTGVSQESLRDTKRAGGYFLSCRCVPEGDMTVTLPDEPVRTFETCVLERTLLNHEVIRLRLQKPAGLDYHGGQFIQLHGPKNTVRSYSLASTAKVDPWLELHIRRVPFGIVSNWAHDALTEGTNITISTAMGESFYLPERRDQPLLLIGTGSGLAPLWGILRDALHSGHSAPIHLYHGGSYSDGLYLVDELRSLAASHEGFHYTPTLSRDRMGDVAKGRAHEIALRAHKNLKGWRVFLCGHPDMVKAARIAAFIAGVAMDDLYSDPFVFAPRPSVA